MTISKIWIKMVKIFVILISGRNINHKKYTLNNNANESDLMINVSARSSKPALMTGILLSSCSVGSGSEAEITRFGKVVFKYDKNNGRSASAGRKWKKTRQKSTWPVYFSN